MGSHSGTGGYRDRRHYGDYRRRHEEGGHRPWDREREDRKKDYVDYDDPSHTVNKTA
jgi:hypothetical protein